MTHPKQVPQWPTNLVIVEVLEEDGRHRCYRGFKVPEDTRGNFIDFSEIFLFIDEWKARNPTHFFLLHLKPDKEKIYWRKSYGQMVL